MILRLDAAARDASGHLRAVQDGGEIQAFGLPMVQGLARIEHIDAADHFVEGAEAELGHVLADLLGDEEKEIDDVLGLALELGAQGGVLGGDAHRAGVQMALAHHDAAHGDQRGGGEAEFLGAEQRGDGDIAAGLQLAVGLHADAPAQVVHHQHLLRFGEAQFPGDAGVLDGAERRSAGTAAIAADQHDVGMRFGDARGDGAHADFGHQLDGDAGARIGVLQVVDQLGQILDGIDIVVRRRGDQSHAGDGVAHAGDDFVDLVAGELAAFAGLGALRHLDLQLVAIDQVIGGDAEARGGHLLDGAAAPVAVGIALRNGLRLRRLRRYWTCRRCGSWRWPGFRALPSKWSRRTWRRWRSA